MIDTAAHKLFPDGEDGDPLPGPFEWICDKHDAAIMGDDDE